VLVDPAGLTAKVCQLKPQCAPLPNAICPLTPSLGTVILTLPEFTLVIAASCAEPIHAAVMPDKPEPVMVMTVPGPPLPGEIELMVGCPVLLASASPPGAPTAVNPATMHAKPAKLTLIMNP
jgi:hypothetical protein